MAPVHGGPIPGSKNDGPDGLHWAMDDAVEALAKQTLDNSVTEYVADTITITVRRGEKSLTRRLNYSLLSCTRGTLASPRTSSSP